MYLDNKYTIWYFNIIENAQRRKSDGYFERHHIVPRCLGGGDELENLVDLTAKEHFVCHHLLTRMVTGRAQYLMAYALKSMAHLRSKNHERSYRITSTHYALIKIKTSEYQTELWKDPTYRERMLSYWTPTRRQQQSKRTKELMSDPDWYNAWLKKVRKAANNLSIESKEAKRHVGEANGMWGRTHTEATKKAISDANTGRHAGETYSEIMGEDRAATLKEQRRQQKIDYHRANPTAAKDENNPNSKRVSIKGIEFNMVKLAAKHFNVTSSTVSGWLKHRDDCFYI
jgi:hypothetical protein